MYTGVFLFSMALLFALIEIEAEGSYGWAEKMPTWYRTTGWPAKIYGMLMGGKPLTGYHAYMFALPLLMFHIGFFFGAPWSWGVECRIIAAYFVWAPIWDFLWFVLNPHYGIRKFKPEQVWWHAKSHWIGGLFPLDYAVGWTVSLAVAAVGQRLTGDVLLVPQITTLITLALLTFVTILVAPRYHRWRLSMDERDDRDECIPLR